MVGYSCNLVTTPIGQLAGVLPALRSLVDCCLHSQMPGATSESLPRLRTLVNSVYSVTTFVFSCTDLAALQSLVFGFSTVVFALHVHDVGRT